jgi:hypothetical protein
MDRERDAYFCSGVVRANMRAFSMICSGQYNIQNVWSTTITNTHTYTHTHTQREREERKRYVGGAVLEEGGEGLSGDRHLHRRILQYIHPAGVKHQGG